MLITNTKNHNHNHNHNNNKLSMSKSSILPIMSQRTHRCSGCSVLLSVPPHAKTVRCAVCGATTKLKFHDKPLPHWMRGFLSQFTNFNPNASPHPQWDVAQPASTGRYPMVSGKKRALLVGVSYRGKRYELKGTVNDVNCMKYFLRRHGFSQDCMLVLTEEERDPLRTPTRRNMIEAMQWLVHNCTNGDSLLFYFSGHGSQKPDASKDEVDGFDETLCPTDYEANGMIIDNEINAIIVRPLPMGVKLHAILDSCHSGTALDLPYLCRMNRTGYYQWESHIPKSGVYKGTRGGFAISFSGCDDNQTSADTSALAGDVMTGAMTYSFIQAVESAPGCTYGSLLLAMRTAIKDANIGLRINGPIGSLIKRVFRCGLRQEPQLCSTAVFDVNKKPFLL